MGGLGRPFSFCAIARCQNASAFDGADSFSEKLQELQEFTSYRMGRLSMFLAAVIRPEEARNLSPGFTRIYPG
jgi:hypothetical protein